MKKRDKVINFLETNTYRFIAILIALTYYAKFTKYEINGLNFEYERVLIRRWYSPYFWLFMVVSFILIAIWDGVPKAGQLVWSDIKGTPSAVDNSFGTFKEGLPMWRKKLVLFFIARFQP